VSKRELALSSRTLADTAPCPLIEAAAAAGFGAAGLWIEAEGWSAATTRAVRERLSDTGLRVLDVELLSLASDVTDATLERILEIGGAVGARNALVIGMDPDPGRTSERFAWLCERATLHGIRPALEFMRFTAVRTLDEALEIVRRAAHPAGGILVDALHLIRSGGRPEELALVDPERLPYAQICDASARADDEATTTLIHEALEGRLLPGEGELPLAEIVSRLPAACPLSCEILSSDLRARFPEPGARARAVFEATRRFLERADG
jgi:sugar phosphate isomerase/epimerase